MRPIRKLTEEVIHGRKLRTIEECSILLTSDLAELMEGADEIRRRLCGDKADLCSIINGRSGRCSEDCKFCAQSKCNHTGVTEYDFVPLETIVEDCGRYDRLGVDRYSVVTAGRGLGGEELAKAVEAYATLHRTYPEMKLCGSHGFMSEEGFRMLKEAGVDVVHCNIETSREYFPQICTTHKFEEKLENIRRAKAAGLDICCGGIIGMGESWEDRISMAVTIAEIGAVSVPLNVLVPIPGTPMESMELMKEEDILRTVALFRFIVPQAKIRIAAGRSRFEDGGAELFRAGANATITGDMLTTVGNNTKEDRTMLKDMGYRLRPEKKRE